MAGQQLHEALIPVLASIPHPQPVNSRDNSYAGTIMQISDHAAVLSNGNLREALVTALRKIANPLQMGQVAEPILVKRLVDSSGMGLLCNCTHRNVE